MAIQRAKSSEVSSYGVMMAFTQQIDAALVSYPISSKNVQLRINPKFLTRLFCIILAKDTCHIKIFNVQIALHI